LRCFSVATLRRVMADERRSAAIAIGRRSDDIDLSQLSQSLPCKPRSLARASPALEPPPLELPKSSPAYEPFEDTEKGRTLIRYSAEISAAEFSCSPSERHVLLSQSCPNWSTFNLPKEMPQEVEEHRMSQIPRLEDGSGAMDVPCKRSPPVESVLAEGEVMIGKSPTILESFKMYSPAATFVGVSCCRHAVQLLHSLNGCR